MLSFKVILHYLVLDMFYTSYVLMVVSTIWVLPYFMEWLHTHRPSLVMSWSDHVGQFASKDST